MSLKDFFESERVLGQVIRFGIRKRLKDENVAEHSFHTALYAMILADIEQKKFGNKVNMEKVFRGALLHDLEECMTGDILFHFKHSDEKLTSEIKRIGTKFYEKLIKNLPASMQKDYMEAWLHCKDPNTIEGRIVWAADRLEALFYALDELRLGNKSFRLVLIEIMNDIKKIKLRSLDFVLNEIKNELKTWKVKPK
ncbi:MAG: HD domain-containing protein [Candidatus Parvarchaeota archaeon]|nr:HD domain-containing protein [Candidatus Jingweiarchaeum tengchongense]MCW1298164.1 HD domain-containing protein [Candidatus Jingweiarchaeum tengchongense]MCW1299962.1 HD domain-containing protein [Candidatus Jingweiarchaeum tengchongense]MCW1305053.1 HD domain-containing protein [Candidatus Jingweiarchaeum tengchongense]MCW1305584.1 HD domain-containing protein [Candidatus Jingweiarchaeum tengchongense]